MCKKRFRSTLVDVSGVHTQETVGLSTTGGSSGSPFLIQGKNDQSLYMTPYSSRIFSHPIAVVVVMVIGFSLFVATLVSLGADSHIVKQTCLPTPDDRFYDEF